MAYSNLTTVLLDSDMVYYRLELNRRVIMSLTEEGHELNALITEILIVSVSEISEPIVPSA